MRKSSNLPRDFTAFIAHYFTQRLCVGILLTNLRACDSSSFKTKQDNPSPCPPKKGFLLWEKKTKNLDP